MTLYLDEATLGAAVIRLGESRAISTLADYLVFKRALVLARAQAPADQPAPTAVVTGTASVPFTTAVLEVAGIAVGGLGWSGSPYFSPFGYSRDSGKGYKSSKYPSNGPADAATGWQSRPNGPLELVAGTRPRAFRIVPRDAAELSGFFCLSRESLLKASLLDLAIWWFRATDLHTRFASDPSDAELVAAVVEDLDLTQAERDGLFEPNAAVGDPVDHV